MILAGTERTSRKWAWSLRSIRSGTTPTGRMYIASSISPFPCQLVGRMRTICVPLPGLLLTSILPLCRVMIP